MSKFYIIYTKDLAYKLRERGFRIVNTGINKNHPQFDTYIFENSKDFQNTLHELTAKKN